MDVICPVRWARRRWSAGVGPAERQIGTATWCASPVSTQEVGGRESILRDESRCCPELPYTTSPADDLGVALAPWPVEFGDEIAVKGHPWPVEVVDLA